MVDIWIVAKVSYISGSSVENDVRCMLAICQLNSLATAKTITHYCYMILDCQGCIPQLADAKAEKYPGTHFGKSRVSRLCVNEH